MVEYLNRIGSISSFVLALYNSVGLTVNQKPWWMYITNVLLFIISGVVFLKNKKEITFKIFFLMVGYGALMFGDNANFGGIIYVCYFAHMNKRLAINIYVFSFAVVMILAKGIILELGVSETIILLTGTGITALFFFAVTGKRNLKLKFVNRVSDDHIINLLFAGKNTKEIAAELNITANAVNKHINKLRILYNCTTRDQLIYALARSGKNGLNSDIW